MTAMTVLPRGHRQGLHPALNGSVIARIALLFAALMLLGGCTRMVASFSDEPVDTFHGKRTLGAKIEDSSIRRKARINLYRNDDAFREARMNVDSFNGNVLLTGEIESEELRERATRIAGNIRHVRDVHNEMKVSGPSSLLSRINDGWLTTKTKTRLLLSGATPGRRTRITTSNGTVYLMGLLERGEADAVVEQVQRVYGVQKIIKIIEYSD